MFQEINFPSATAVVPAKTSMIKRIAAITFIFICTAIAWAILGATIFDRTYDSGNLSDSRVQSTWGAPQSQSPPQASFEEKVPKKVTTTENGKTVETVTQETVTTLLPLESSHLNVDLNLEHRQKGLLWYSTYKVGFDGAYSFRNSSDKDQNVTFRLDFPTAQAIYDDLVFTVDGAAVPLSNGKSSASGIVVVKAKSAALLKVAYKSQGLNDWRYNFTGPVSATGEGANDVAQVRDFSLKMTTNFTDIDFPENTLSPISKTATSSGWALAWTYQNLVSGYQI